MTGIRLNVVKQKLLLGLLLFMVTQTAFSQTIFREEKDSILIVTTLAKFDSHIGSLKNRIATSLTYGLNQKNNAEYFSLNFILETCERKFYIDQGAKARFTTFSGSTFSLKQELADLKQESEYRPFLRTTLNYYLINPSYQIQKNELNILMNEGVKSIDFITTKGIVLFIFDKDAIGKTLQEEYDIVLKNKSFDQDF